jgi:hypothetical protein
MIDNTIKNNIERFSKDEIVSYVVDKLYYYNKKGDPILRKKYHKYFSVSERPDEY